MSAYGTTRNTVAATMRLTAAAIATATTLTATTTNDKIVMLLCWCCYQRVQPQ